MATTYPGGQSPTTFSKTLERVFDDAQHTGEVILSGRKLKDYPSICTKFDLVDTIVADLSKNRLTELPAEVCEYTSMERLNGYHNVMRSIPQAIIQLQALTHLNLSRNMLCNIPPFICQLQALEVMIASNNKLVSLPEEIGQLDKLMDLDVSCNEISHLPSQIGDLEALRILNIRRNLLIELPVAMCKLKLRRLDFSENKISSIPTAFRSLEMLEEMVLDHNPLTTPPAHVCKKGRVHIMKFLQIEALKEDRKRGMLSDNDMKRLVRKSLPQQPVGSDDFKHINDSQGWKRHTVVGNDSGYNTTDSNEKCNWSPMEAINDFDEINALALKAGEAVKEQRHHREMEAQRRMGTPHDTRRLHGLTTSPLGGHVSEAPPSPAHLSRLHPSPSPQSNTGRHAPLESSPRTSRGPGLSLSNNINHSPVNSHSPLMQSRSPYHGHSPHPQSASPSPSSPALPPSPDTPPLIASGTPTEDAFTRELQRQRADYERRKKVAEQIKLQQQQQLDEEEKEERRRATLKVQEEQQRVLEQKKDAMRREAEARHNDNNNGIMDGDQKSPPQGAPQTRSPAKGNNPAGTPTQPKKKLENNFIPIPVVHMNHEPSEDTSPTSPSMLPTRKTTTVTSVREERRGAGSQYRRTASDSVPQTGRMGRASVDNQRNGVGEEKVKSAGPSPASSVSSIASNPRSTASPRHTPAVRKVPIEDRRSTQSPGTRRTKPAANTTTTTRTRGTASTVANRTRTTSGSSGGGRGGITRTNHMTPRSVFNGDDAKHTSPRNNLTSTKHRQVLATDAIKMLEDYKDPGFTIRRQQEHARGDMEQLDMLRNHIEGRLKVTLPDNLPDALRDGVVLCHLANQIRPRSVASIHVPSPAVPKLTLAKCRRNVENFLEACRKIGVNNEQICSPHDILEEKGIMRLVITVGSLVAIATNPKQSAV